MNKKRLLIYLIIGIVVIIALLSILFTIPKKVEKIEGIKIIDPYSVEVVDYANNTMPFVIEKINSDAKVYINGKRYNGERLYNVGEYKVVVKQKNKREQISINILEVEKTEENIYRIYVVSETLQTLLANLDISSNINQKGFLWTARTSTINMDKLKENVPNIVLSKFNGSTDGNEFKLRIIPEIKKYIKEVLQEDSKACFELYMEEDKFYLELELFGKIGLDDNRYNVIMYTNGTLGYVREYEMTEEDVYDRFCVERKEYMNIVEKIKNNTLETNDFPGSYLVDKTSTVFKDQMNLDYMYISTLRNNIKLLMQYPEMIVFKDQNVAKEMQNANIEKIMVQDEFKLLEDDEKEIFFSNIDLKKDELDKNYFTDKNKEYLVITGTTPFYGEYSKTDFERIMKKVSEDYGKKYVLLYKPHPRELPTKEQEKFLNKLGVKVLPGKLPMEAISFVYSTLKLGGFDSSLYLSVDQGKTLFFFAKDKTELWSPLDVLYDNMFIGAKFYN